MFEGEDVDLSDGEKTRISGDKPKYLLNWRRMTTAELLKARQEIDQHLPPAELSEMNLEKELIMQYRTACTLQTDVLADDEVPRNQQAQVLNAVTASLDRLTKLQADLYTTERYKGLEQILIRHLKSLPEDTAKAFLADYRVLLGG